MHKMSILLFLFFFLGCWGSTKSPVNTRQVNELNSVDGVAGCLAEKHAVLILQHGWSVDSRQFANKIVQNAYFRELDGCQVSIYDISESPDILPTLTHLLDDAGVSVSEDLNFAIGNADGAVVYKLDGRKGIVTVQDHFRKVDNLILAIQRKAGKEKQAPPY